MSEGTATDDESPSAIEEAPPPAPAAPAPEAPAPRATATGGGLPPDRPTPRRGRETVRDMVWSLAAVGLLVAFLVAVTYRDRPDPIRVVDPVPAGVQAKQAAPFDVVVPAGLPAEWKPTSAGYAPATRSAIPNAASWQVGYVTPAGDYAALAQAEGDPAVAVRNLVEGARPAGEGAGPFVGWARWESDSGRQAYVLERPDSTVVVFGTASDEELAVLAAALRPDPTR